MHMNSSKDNDIKDVSSQAHSDSAEEKKKVFLKPEMTEEEKEILEQLREFRNLHNQIPEEDLIPISHPDKYSLED
jgi:hypothetical protein